MVTKLTWDQTLQPGRQVSWETARQKSTMNLPTSERGLSQPTDLLRGGGAMWKNNPSGPRRPLFWSQTSRLTALWISVSSPLKPASRCPVDLPNSPQISHPSLCPLQEYKKPEVSSEKSRSFRRFQKLTKRKDTELGLFYACPRSRNRALPKVTRNRNMIQEHRWKVPASFPNRFPPSLSPSCRKGQGGGVLSGNSSFSIAVNGIPSEQ